MQIKENIKTAIICTIMPFAITFPLYRHSHIRLTSGILVVFLFLATMCVIIPKAGFYIHNIGCKVGKFIGRYLSIIALFIVYVCAVLPTGILMKIVKRDRLRLKNPAVESYWIKYDTQSSDYENQF